MPRETKLVKTKKEVEFELQSFQIFLTINTS